MVLYRTSNKLTSSVSVLAITIALVAGQSATQKSLAQFATSPAIAPAVSVNGAGASTLNTLFVGTGETNPCPFGSKGSWLNVYGVGNPPSLNNDLAAITNNCPVGTYGPATTSSTFRYAPVGSGAGVTAFFTQTPPSVPAGTPALNNLTILPPVSFAGTDDPLAGTDIERIATGTPNSGKAIQVPVIGVGIALAFNRTGLNVPATGLKFSRPTYCAILNGTLTNWNDARIRTDNGGAVISANLPLKFVRRSDNSGSTFVLSTHLNTACKTTGTPGLPTAAVWNRGVGSISTSGTVPPTPPANTVVWPTTFLSASGGGGVATTISTTSGAIGYVDSATRLARSLPAAFLKNKSGAYVGLTSGTNTPVVTGIQAALSAGTIVKYGTAPNNRLIRIDGLADPTAAAAYPISTASYLLFYDVYGGTNGTAISTNIRGFINWALGATPTTNPTADAIATVRGYAPLPTTIKTVSTTVVNTCVNTTSGSSPCTP
ncbi:substrate-binding domain-containing protein [Nostoc sp. C117]|uniref:substrate-binding domain-containing protein n=1 Tax=Nostoc sp. C117 TaxID=3349875 RepID=UPI00370DBD12